MIDLYTTHLDSRDPQTVGEEYDDLMRQANGHGIDAFNNLYRRFNARDPKTGIVWREQARAIDPEYYEEQLKKTFRQSGDSPKHSDLYLDKTREEFYRDIDNAAKSVLLNPQEDIEKPLATEIGTDTIYANPKMRSAYISLRELGYTHFDLAS